jgi:hypothetical protein
LNFELTKLTKLTKLTRLTRLTHNMKVEPITFNGWRSTFNLKPATA